MLLLGGDVLGLAPCLPCWPLRPRDPAWACWGWRALATRLAPVACPWPWSKICRNNTHCLAGGGGGLTQVYGRSLPAGRHVPPRAHTAHFCELPVFFLPRAATLRRVFSQAKRQSGGRHTAVAFGLTDAGFSGAFVPLLSLVRCFFWGSNLLRRSLGNDAKDDLDLK